MRALPYLLALAVAGALASGTALAAPGGGKGKPGGGGGGGDGAAANPALVFWDGSDSIDVADADGGNRAVLLSNRYGGCTFPKWSPDGERVVYPASFRIFIVNKDGSGDMDVTPEGLEWSGACALDWSQGPVLGGDDLIAFVGAPEGLDLEFPESAYHVEVYILNPDTREVHQLTNSGQSENAVSWSHDGQSLAVTRVDFNNSSYQQLVILHLELDDNGVPHVAREQDVTPPGVFDPWNQLSWASQGNKILYPGEGDIRMVTFDPELGLLSVESITGGPGQFNLGREFWPSWAPGDEEIVFVVQGSKHRDSGVYRMNLFNGTAEKIFDRGPYSGPYWPDWRPNWSEAP